MKKKCVRLFAIALCVIMMFGLVPNQANALALQGKKMLQLQSIKQSGETFFFETYSDLENLALLAAGDPDSFYNCIFAGWGSCDLPSNRVVTIPENMQVQITGADFEIGKWDSLVVKGTVICYEDSDVYVEGTVNVTSTGVFVFTDTMYVTGSMRLAGTLQLRNGQKTTLLGESRITMVEYGVINVQNTITSAEEFINIRDIAEAEEMKDPLRTQLVFVDAPIEINAESLRLPYNMVIVANQSISFNTELWIDGSVLRTSAPVYLNGATTNFGYIDVFNDEGGSLVFGPGVSYRDTADMGVIWVDTAQQSALNQAVKGIDLSGFKTSEYYAYDGGGYWTLSDYEHQHVIAVRPAVAPTCLDYGYAEGSYCSFCMEVIEEGEKLAPLGHMYSDFYDTSCDVCGAVRVVNPTHLTSSMYRMYNPNTGEHFYTGSMEERRTIEAAGWKYEGVGFTICANEGEPVYRLFQPSTGEHLYTMDVNEKNHLAANGWNVEGIAFNSCPNKDVPQYRLWNPNATVGAYHFTASLEEKNNLLNAGWIDQGIGFYSCWQ